MDFSMSGITILRDFKFKQVLNVDASVAELEFFRNYNFKNKNYGGSWKFESVNRDSISAVYQILRENISDVRLHVHMSSATIYTNNLNLYNSLINVNGVNNIDITEAKITLPKESVICAKSKYNIRSYFKDYNFKDYSPKETLAKWLLNQKDIRLSPSLARWCEGDYIRFRGIYKHYFIDHSDERILTLLSLVNPNIFRKSVKIIKGK